MKPAKRNEIIVDRHGIFFGVVTDRATKKGKNEAEAEYAICGLMEKENMRTRDLDEEGCAPSGVSLSKNEIRMCELSVARREQVRAILKNPMEPNARSLLKNASKAMEDLCVNLGMKRGGDMDSFAQDYLQKKLKAPRKKNNDNGGQGARGGGEQASAAAKAGKTAGEKIEPAEMGTIITDCHGRYFGYVCGIVSMRKSGPQGIGYIISGLTQEEFWSYGQLIEAGFGIRGTTVYEDEKKLLVLLRTRFEQTRALLADPYALKATRDLKRVNGEFRRACRRLGMEKDGDADAFAAEYLKKKLSQKI